MTACYRWAPATARACYPRRRQRLYQSHGDAKPDNKIYETTGRRGVQRCDLSTTGYVICWSPYREEADGGKRSFTVPFRQSHPNVYARRDALGYRRQAER